MTSYNRHNNQNEAILMDVMQPESLCRSTGIKTKTKVKVIQFGWNLP